MKIQTRIEQLIAETENIIAHNDKRILQYQREGFSTDASYTNGTVTAQRYFLDELNRLLDVIETDKALIAGAVKQALNGE